MHPQSRNTGLHTWILVLAVGLARVLGAWSCHTYDDAFITFRYAENLAMGDGLVFNPGAPWEPILGTTAPLYALILAIPISLGLDAVTASIIVNLLCDMGSAFLLLQLLGRWRIVASLSVIAFAVFPPLVRISAGGMEAPVLCVLVLLATWLRNRDHPASAGLAAALACTCRPEAVLFALVLAPPRSQRGSLQLIRFAAPVILVGVAYVIITKIYYGESIPQSVIAKGTRDTADSLRSARQVLEQTFLPARQLIFLLPLVLLGAWHAFRRARAIRPVFYYSLILTGAYLVAQKHTWGWYFYVQLMVWVIWLSFGTVTVLHFLAKRWAPARRLHRVRHAAATTIAVLSLGAAGTYTTFAHNAVTTKVYERIEEVVDDLGIKGREDVTLLAWDVGAIAYYAKCRILDAAALTWKAAMRNHISQLVDQHSPDYILLTMTRAQLPKDHDPPWRHDGRYEPLVRINTTGNTELHPKITDLPTHWVQDYILYRRRPQ